MHSMHSMKKRIYILRFARQHFDNAVNTFNGVIKLRVILKINFKSYMVKVIKMYAHLYYRYILHPLIVIKMELW